MRGIVKEVNSNSTNKKGRPNPNGVIKGNDGKEYYFNQDSMPAGQIVGNLYQGDAVIFEVKPTASARDYAFDVKLEVIPESKRKIEFATAGVAKRLDMDKAEDSHLKEDSGEREVIEKLGQVLRITRVGHHSMDQVSNYAFCLASVTEAFKQYIRESGEFLVVFSHFDDKSWQQKTFGVEREIRKRRDIVERRPLVNFYILISNATELRAKVDSEKGKPQASVIPFSFEELLACKDENELTECMLNRFGEYYFENNMLGENKAIDDDDLLFGDRGKIADAVVARCHGGENSGIFGLRRSGKTSVLNAVLRRLDWEEIPYIKVECRAYETMESWKDALFEIACDVRAKTLGIQREPGERLQQYYKRLNLNNMEEDYEKRAVKMFVEDIQSYCNGKLFVIALDEVELITFNTATSIAWRNLEAYKGFWSALRDCGCPLVVCGVNSTINEEGNLEFNDQQCDNPMYGRIVNCSDSSSTYLPAFTDEQTKVMINTLGNYSNIAFSQVYSIINRAFGGQPWAIRQFCSFVFEKVRDQRKPNEAYEVGKATCDNLMREFQNSALGIRLCETILQYLGIYHEEYVLLKKAALSPEAYSSIAPEEIVYLDHLQKYGLVNFDADTGYFSFSIGIIPEHIRRSEVKAPEDMNNLERIRYVHDRIRSCEKKLKRYILNYYTYVGDEEEGIALFFGEKGKCILRPHDGIDPETSEFRDFFDHKKYDFYFSTLKRLIAGNWDTLGKKLSKHMTLEKFKVSMDDMNAGRTDADHYDPENMPGYPEEWDIDDATLRSFRSAYETMEKFFKANNL